MSTAEEHQQKCEEHAATPDESLSPPLCETPQRASTQPFRKRWQESESQADTLFVINLGGSTDINTLVAARTLSVGPDHRPPYRRREEALGKEDEDEDVGVAWAGRARLARNSN